MPDFIYRSRDYLHFDRPVSKSSATQVATDPVRVARHAFLPFIRYIVVTQKIRQGKDGRIKVREPKRRPIDYAGHMDSHIFAHYSAVLTERYEQVLNRKGLQRAVTAFRPLDRWSNIHFANEAFEFIRASQGAAVLATDISDYFGKIRHDHLKAAWTTLLDVDRLPDDHFKVFRAITKYSVVDREKLCAVLNLAPDRPRADGRHRYCTPAEFRNIVRANGLIQANQSGVGIPQGSPISAILSNIYLLDFDESMNAFALRGGGLYRRYCDDILLVVPTATERAEGLALMQGMLADLGLVAHPDKTELVNFVWNGQRLVTPKPLNYLGFTFDGMFKRLRPASIARFYRKMRLGVGRAKAQRHNAANRSGRWRSLSRRRLFLLYSYIGRRNFISYAHRAARIMNDIGIKKQVKAHWRKLHALMKSEAQP